MRHVDIVDDENRKPRTRSSGLFFNEETRFDLDTVRDTLTKQTVMIIKGVVVKQQCIKTE